MMPGLIPVRIRKPRRADSFFATSRYIGDVADKVFRLVRRGQVVLLLAPLGSGKSEVLRVVAERVNGERGSKAVVLDMGRADPPRTPADLWRDVALKSRPAPEIVSIGGPAATTLLRAHATGGRDHLVVLIDHIELVDEDWLFNELRAAVERSSGEADRGAGVTVVVASTEALTYRLFRPTSPFHGISQTVTMADCAVDIRRAFWSERLRSIRQPRRDELVDAFDTLCAGDPYQIEEMSAFLASQTQGERLTIERVDDALRSARANPARPRLAVAR